MMLENSDEKIETILIDNTSKKRNYKRCLTLLSGGGGSNLNSLKTCKQNDFNP